jgi:hypothetical protein
MAILTRRLRVVLGFVAGAMFVASSAAHSLVGWKGLTAELAKTSAPADLVRGLGIGWHFAGVAMLAFGCIVLLVFNDLAKGRAVSLRPAVLIALAYLAFGTYALAITKEPFFGFTFLAPGLLLLIASTSSS